MPFTKKRGYVAILISIKMWPLLQFQAKLREEDDFSSIWFIGIDNPNKTTGFRNVKAKKEISLDTEGQFWPLKVIRNATWANFHHWMSIYSTEGPLFPTKFVIFGTLCIHRDLSLQNRRPAGNYVQQSPRMGGSLRENGAHPALPNGIRRFVGKAKVSHFNR